MSDLNKRIAAVIERVKTAAQMIMQDKQTRALSQSKPRQPAARKDLLTPELNRRNRELVNEGTTTTREIAGQLKPRKMPPMAKFSMFNKIGFFKSVAKAVSGATLTRASRGISKYIPKSLGGAWSTSMDDIATKIGLPKWLQSSAAVKANRAKLTGLQGKLEAGTFAHPKSAITSAQKAKVGTQAKQMAAQSGGVLSKTQKAMPYQPTVGDATLIGGTTYALA